MALKTTTWKDRNIPNLERTLRFAKGLNIQEPLIINYGPGGSVAFMAKRLPQGRKSDLRVGQRFYRVLESFVRKTQLFPLQSNEPKELVRVFRELNPKGLLCVDIEKKVLKAVRRMADRGEIAVPVECSRINLQKEVLDREGDIVIALNIVARTSNPAETVARISSSVAKGGLVCINIDEAPEGFKKLGEHVFVKKG